uniref:Uncharacterized protein n=1 Tax=Kwoniella pini CBS 10737 TaxID=1296096 RepID=A0A1B9I2E8_9TREE|nr:uncharacterized protein I206_04143 [Kwoniella pini CBS 10737]OCF49621.1 hypothetical protein I206_04143 [Kwoniella pini CBS 10737]
MSSYVPPTAASSVSCSCGSKNPSSLCTCQKEGECKCAPGSCTCPGCPVHEKKENPCTCQPECKCAPGKCECGSCPNSNKNKEKACGVPSGDEVAVKPALVHQVNAHVPAVLPKVRKKSRNLALVVNLADVLQANALVRTAPPLPNRP